MKEKWIEIEQIQGYIISNFGEIVSLKRKNRKILKQKKNKNGYYSVRLSLGNGIIKDYLVHRLVLSNFKPTKNMNLLEVNHIDEDKSNNNLDNLEWITSKDNCNYGKRNEKISNSQSTKVKCVETGIVFINSKIASEVTGTCRSSISNCLNGKRKLAGKCHWELVYE